MPAPNRIRINRAPVMTLWTEVVARRLGFDEDEALTLGRVVTGLNAYAKGKSLGLYEPQPESLREQRKRAAPGAAITVSLLNRLVPAVKTPQGLRALSHDKPVSPESVRRYLQSKFGDALGSAEAAMMELAASLTPEALAARAYELYEAFRPRIPSGVRGWGAAGDLDLTLIRRLAEAPAGALRERAAPAAGRRPRRG